MNTTIESLPDDPRQLKALLLKECHSSAKKDSEIQTLREKNQYLLEQFRLAQQKQFGKSSEAHPGQGELFNEAEQLLDQEVEAETKAVSTTKRQPKRQALPKDLEREVRIIDIADEDKQCDCCGHDLHQMGEKKSEQLKFIPAEVKVIETIRPQYSCRHCEKTALKVQIKIAPVPLSPIPKSIATPSLLSQIITSKYQYSLPLNRQEMMFKQHGIELNRKTMSEWMIKSSTLFKPIVNYLHQQLLKQTVIQADETTLKVVHEDKTKCYMWVYCSGTDSPVEHGHKNIVLYDYQASRAGACAVNYLKGFDGILQADGYAGYKQVDTTLIGCMAHARRKFVDAQTAQPKNKTGRADWAIRHIKKLYRIEAVIKDLTADEKMAYRQENSLPLLNDFKKWLDKSIQQVLPKSAIGKAIQYTLNQWSKLTGYIKSGETNIDNNRAERAIKPFVIGRKNWMFCNTASGATASAILYSLIETARANGLTPFNYLVYLLEELPKKPENLDYLMPWNVELETTIKG
nr:IS66 family transposase [Pseudodesulfovibrio sp.]